MNIHDYRKIRWTDKDPIPGIDGLYHQVIEIRNLYNHRIYVCVHSTRNPNDNYMGSGASLGRAYKRFGKSAFLKRILHYAKDVDELRFWERIIVDDDFIRTSHTYNKYKGGGGKKPQSNNQRKRVIIKEVTKDTSNQMTVSDSILQTVHIIINKVKEFIWHLYQAVICLI